ncbi:MAG: carbon-nitrogen hydrolase family protein [Atopobiaceae bacterium]|nr:carbon-nitrogen hydrolase family protein [Atopobiaceae bacterium]
MRFTVALAQCGFPADGDVLSQVDAWCEEASSQGADLVVFPENLMSPRPLSAQELHDIAEPLNGPFALAMAACADRHGVWVAYTQYESDDKGGRPFNTAVLLDDSGTARGSYRKTHLYDAHGVLESERTGRGDALFAPIDTPFGKVGLSICYDLRFPEVARAAAIDGADLLILPAAWHDGQEKAAHWETLLKARAIENEVFVLAAGKAGERYVGQSMVVDPLGRVLARAEAKDQELVTCTIDLSEVSAARDAMPLLAHRRPELYRLA